MYGFASTVKRCDLYGELVYARVDSRCTVKRDLDIAAAHECGLDQDGYGSCNKTMISIPVCTNGGACVCEENYCWCCFLVTSAWTAGTEASRN